jgi:hypothetical protein
MGSKLLAGCSFKEIAYWANEQGYKTAEGKMWYAVTIRNSLRRVRYAGIREHRGKQYPAAWPTIFGPAAWEQMQLKIMLSAERFAGRRKARKYLLTGRVYLVPGQFADLLRDAAPNDDKLKQLLDRRAAPTYIAVPVHAVW